MVGGITEVGVRCWDREAAVHWYWSEPDTLSIGVAYEIESWDRLLEGAFSAFSDDRDPICPFDEQKDDWSIDFYADDRFSEEAKGVALSDILAPCDKDRGGADRRLLGEGFGLGSWRWNSDRWEPVGRS
jgi:hypothetical protein